MPISSVCGQQWKYSWKNYENRNAELIWLLNEVRELTCIHIFGLNYFVKIMI